MENSTRSIQQIKKGLFREFVVFQVDNNPTPNSLLKTLNDVEKLAGVRLVSFKKGAHLIKPFCKLNNIGLNDELNTLVDHLSAPYDLTRFILQEKAIEDISKVLDEAKIRYVFIKGAETRDYYKNRSSRISNDLDILIDKEDLRDIDKLLVKKLSGEFEHYDVVHDSFFLYQKLVRIEAHKALFTFDTNKAMNNTFSKPFDHIKPREEGTYRCHFDSSFEYAYLLGHIFKHLKGNGTYIPNLADLLCLSNQHLIDKDEVERLVKQAKLDKFYHVLAPLLDKYYSGEELTTTENSLENFMLASEDNTLVYMEKYKNKTKGKYILSRLWISRENLEMRYYNLSKHPKLLPYYEVKRWFESFFSKKRVTHAAENVKKFGIIKEEKIKENEALFKEIGL